MIKTGKELAESARNVAENYSTLYVLGCIGAPLNSANKVRYTKNQAFNRRDDRTWKIRNASADTFGFDCVCLIKSLLWGWNGDTGKVYGGATYASRKIPDWSANTMIANCKGVTTDFSHISVGEAVWIKDHIGIYIGDGLAVECTCRKGWKDGVQVTAVHNISTREGYNGRYWTKHGKLPWLTYSEEETPVAPATPTTPTTPATPAVNHKYDTTVTLSVVKYGSRGGNAKALQALLSGYGYPCGSLDGIFGGKSVTALKEYQKANGLTADGVCGRGTWRKLMGQG